jgi:gamma-glutamylcyclotransferase (GGCT)/AIG2-like uncharacterized protein YtfP
MTSQLLFVYGTLKSDASNVNAQYLHQHARLLGEATWEGSLYLVRNYPGAVRSQLQGDLVLGELWELSNPEELLASLDEYEECSPTSPLPHEYERSIESILFRGEFVKAWVYIYQLDIAPLQKISTGNFVNENKTLIRRNI